MKTILKSIFTISIIIITFFFSSCDKELYELPIKQSKQIKVTSERVSLNQVLTEINNPAIENYLNQNVKQEIGLAENGRETLLFEKLVKEDAYTTYSLFLNTYTEDKPYFLFFIITKEGPIEKVGYSKYIPTEPTVTLDIENFTGKVQILDSEREVKIEADLLNSEPIQATTFNTSCETSFYVVQHNCTNGGDHPPGTSCAAGQINDGYFELVSVTVCTTEPDPMYMAPPDAFLGSSYSSSGGTGGNGSLIYLTNNQNVLNFLYDLLPNQLSLIISNPTLISYLEQNQASPESVQTIVKLIEIMTNYGGSFTIDENVNSDNALVFDTDIDLDNYFALQIDEASDFEYTNIDQLNEKISSSKFWVGAPYHGVKVNVKQKMTNPYSVENVTSELFGVTIFADWHQSDYSVSISNNVVTVDVYGVSSIKIFFESVGTVYHENQHFQIKINKLTGEIISAVVIHN